MKMNLLFRNKSITFLDMCGMALGATSFSYLYRVAIKESDKKKNRVSIFKLKKY